jgi:hypothetical protein
MWQLEGVSKWWLISVSTKYVFWFSIRSSGNLFLTKCLLWWTIETRRQIILSAQTRKQHYPYLKNNIFSPPRQMGVRRGATMAPHTLVDDLTLTTYHTPWCSGVCFSTKRTSRMDLFNAVRHIPKTVL